jgi:hypothetical protein
MNYSDNEFIKLNRKIKNWRWFSDVNTAHFFIYCLLSANWKERCFKETKVERGQFVRTYKNMSAESGLSVQNIRTAIKHLISTGEITVSLTGKGRGATLVITVVKYEEYQQANMKNNTLPNNQLTTNQHKSNNQSTQIEEDKNIRSKEVKKKDLLNISDDIFNRPSDTDKKHESLYQEYLDLWNSLKSYGIAPLRAISEQRAKLLKPRLEMYGKDSFAECIEQIKQSDFLQGKHGGKPWTITFDWMIKPSNYPKVLEGNYRNKNDSSGSNQQGYLSDIMQMIGGD